MGPKAKIAMAIAIACASAGPCEMSRSTARPTAMPQALPKPWAARPTCTTPMPCAIEAMAAPTR